MNRNYISFKSNDPCTDIYAGPSPASEPETNAVINFVTARAGQWESFLSIHSYGNWWYLFLFFKFQMATNFRNILPRSIIDDENPIIRFY